VFRGGGEKCAQSYEPHLRYEPGDGKSNDLLLGTLAGTEEQKVVVA